MPSLEPQELVRVAGRLTELVFAREYGKVPWLLVRLARGDDELAAALRAADARAGASGPVGQIGFHTEVVSEAPIRVARDGAHGVGPDWTGLMRMLGDDQHHAVPLKKRTDVDVVFEDRVSIGRALNKDIVLRHASISKFHAYLELLESNRCTVADAGSKNGTIVNGSRANSKEPVEVVSGDHLVFGSVSTVILDAGTLWRVLRGR
jgi:FHA domain